MVGRLKALFVGELSVTDVTLLSVSTAELDDLYLKYSVGYRVSTSRLIVFVDESNLGEDVGWMVSLGGINRRSLVESAMMEAMEVAGALGRRMSGSLKHKHKLMVNHCD